MQSTGSPLQAGYSRSRIAQSGWAGPHSPMSRKRSRFVLSLPHGYSMLHLASHPCSASACRDGELYSRKHWDALLLSVCPHVFVLHILYCCSKQANPVRERETTCVKSPRHGAQCNDSSTLTCPLLVGLVTGVAEGEDGCTSPTSAASLGFFQPLAKSPDLQAVLASRMCLDRTSLSLAGWWHDNYVGS